MAKPDQNQILRLLPLLGGTLGGGLLLFNRLSTLELNNSQARSDVLGVILSALLILVGLLWQQIQPRNPETVNLIGQEGFELEQTLPDVIKTELAWASHILLTNTVTRSVVIYYQGKVILRRGILAPKAEVTTGAIIERCLTTGKAVYLVSLKIYPARIEFDYLPENTQGVICQPLGKQGVMILGANAPRSYTKQDENWIASIADKLTLTLETN
jgi:hypothetical protein